MIAAVDFIALDTFEAVTSAPDMLAISIGDPDQSAPLNLAAFAAGLRLQFLDCDGTDVQLHGIPEAVLLSAAQMAQLLTFVRAHHAEPLPYRLVVHCRAGSSRSAAVALVAHHLTQCDFPRHADAHYANRHVLGLAARELGAIAAPQKAVGPEPHAYLPLQLQI